MARQQRARSDASSAEIAGARSTGIDKSLPAFQRRAGLRDQDHVKLVAQQPCLVCGRRPRYPSSPLCAIAGRLDARSATSSLSRFVGAPPRGPPLRGRSRLVGSGQDRPAPGLLGGSDAYYGSSHIHYRAIPSSAASNIRQNKANLEAVSSP